MINEVKVLECPNPGIEALLEALWTSSLMQDGLLVLNWSPKDSFSYGSKDYVLLDPVAKISARPQRSYLEVPNGAPLVYPSAWGALEELTGPLDRYTGEADCALPYLAGFFTYEFLHEIEEVSQSAKREEFALPLYLLHLYGLILELPKERHLNAKLHMVNYAPFSKSFWGADVVEELWRCLRAPAINFSKAPTTNFDFRGVLPQHSNFCKESYLQNIHITRERILDGEVYQVNLSQKFTLPFEQDGSSYYRSLRHRSPANYSTFLQLANNLSIASASPERFLKCDGENLFCSPIKGTRPRGATRTLDAKMRAELLTSDKDQAELAMIVDLIRNDFGRVAALGSVRVLQHARLEMLSHVHHLVSDVGCLLREEVRSVDVVRALFPCGSITGAPKIAAMRVIAELERSARGIYTGALGYIGLNRAMEFNVAIRTALLTNGKLVFNAGGGIVVDSNPEDEYLETLFKARAMVEAWEDALGLADSFSTYANNARFGSLEAKA